MKKDHTNWKIIIQDLRELIINYFRNDIMKTELSLSVSFGINILYAAFKVVMGLFFHSLWYLTIALYYIILSVTRFHLIRSFMVDGSLRMGYHREITTGILLLGLNVILMGMTILTISNQVTLIVPVGFIYVTILYTIYCFVDCITNFVRDKGKTDSIHTTSKAIILVTVFISVYCMQIYLLQKFSTDILFKNHMNGLTGSAVVILINLTGLYLVIRGISHHRKIEW